MNKKNTLLIAYYMSLMFFNPAIASKQNHQGDLNNRLAELQSKVEALENNSLTKSDGATDGNNLKLKLYGHVNRAMIYRHNGVQGHLDHGDNDALSSRFAFLATAQSGPKQTVGGLLELNMLQNPVSSSDIRNNRSSPASSPTLRNAHVFVQDQTFGELYLGRGSMASYLSVQETDLSGVSHVLTGAIGFDMLGAVSLINKDTRQRQNLGGGTTTTLRVQDVVAFTDGLSRQDRIRYNTPSFGGFVLGASHAYNTPSPNKGNDLWDVALRWNATVNEHKFSAVAAYAEDHTQPMKGNVANTNTSLKQFSGSIGVLYKNGISLFLAGAHRHYTFKGSRNGHMLFGKIGYQTSLTQAGKTSIAVDLGDYQNFVIDNTSTNSLRFKYRGIVKGIALNQNFERIATDIYVTYRHINFKFKGHGNEHRKFKPVQAVLAGARVKF